MSDSTDSPPRKGGSQLRSLILLLGFLIAARGGFYASWARIIPLPEAGVAAIPSAQPSQASGVASIFLPMTPITVNVGGTTRRHLRFTAELDVSSAGRDTVSTLMPRLVDVTNTYLHALDPSELESPAILHRLRAQLLRRLRMVSGPGLINDILITEFVFA